ncbi:MAG: hypothetical protein AB2A00_38915 [Myxococcota bacterium]
MQRRLAAAVAFVCGTVLTCTAGPPFPFMADAGHGGVDAATPDPGPEPIYDGDAQDEVWRAFVDAKGRTTDDATEGSTFQVPTEGQTLTPATPVTFVWNTPLASALPATGPAVPLLRGPAGLGVFSVAHAHGPELTGDASWLIFHIPGRDDFTVLTTNGSWTPEADAWAALTAQSDVEITAEIYTAYFERNRITDGPYKAPGVRRFRIQ